MNTYALNPLLLLTLLILLTACSSSVPLDVGTDSEPNPELFSPGIYKEQTIVVNRVSRSFTYLFPENPDASPLPLVFLLHGSRSNTDALTGDTISKAPFSIWRDIAETEKVIVVYPQGVEGSDGNTGWNDCRTDATTNPTLDDVAFISELITFFSAGSSIDANRIYASGISNGGHMSLRLALELSNKIAAVAPVAAAMPAVGCSTPVNPVSILFMNGTDDPLLPFSGGEVAPDAGGRGTVLSAQASIDLWVTFNQASATPVTRAFDDMSDSDGSTVSSATYTDGLNNTEVVLYEVLGGGHLEPSIQEQYLGFVENSLGRQNHDIEMASEIWDFFQDKTLN